jgi:hypothetical protein
MWKSGNGLKRLSISLLLLVLVVGSINAWSFGFREKPQAQAVEAEAVSAYELQLIENLQTVLQEQEKALLKAKDDLMRSQKDLNLARLDLSRASSEIERLKGLLSISSATQNDVVAELQSEKALRIAKEAEAMRFYQQMKPVWGGTVGVGTTWSPAANSFSLDLEMGVRYDSWTLAVGAQMMPTWNDLLDFGSYIPSAYTARINYGF